MKTKVDKYIFGFTIFYLIVGFLMFFSASLGVMARNEEKFFNILSNQFFFGILLGSLSFIIGIFIPYKFWKKTSYFIFIIATILCALVFAPGIGFYFNGSYRWISIFGFSFQPSEIFKYSSILALATFYGKYYKSISDYRYRILPVIAIALLSIIVLVEPDFGTTSIILAGAFGVFVAVAAKIKDVVIGVMLFIFCLFAFYLYYPHANERISTFLNPTTDLLGKSYQLNQGLISIGSGGLTGYGYAQSAQKYYHLPEPVGDSIFAVIAEEFGFVGSIFLIILLLSLSLRILFLGFLSNDIYYKSILTGVAVVLSSQSFLNIGSISGAIPLTGVPLPLVSHGSTSMILTLGMLGICAQIGGKINRYKV